MEDYDESGVRVEYRNWIGGRKGANWMSTSETGLPLSVWRRAVFISLTLSVAGVDNRSITRSQLTNLGYYCLAINNASMFKRLKKA